jgi:SNF2 family DNA or RNA helicase
LADLAILPRHLDGTLTTLRYHGPRRKVLALETADLVLTTYYTIVSDFGDKLSLLHAMEWYRVVLDEGNAEHDWQLSVPLIHPKLTSYDDKSQPSSEL